MGGPFPLIQFSLGPKAAKTRFRTRKGMRPIQGECRHVGKTEEKVSRSGLVAKALCLLPKSSGIQSLGAFNPRLNSSCTTFLILSLSFSHVARNSRPETDERLLRSSLFPVPAGLSRPISFYSFFASLIRKRPSISSAVARLSRSSLFSRRYFLNGQQKE